MVLLLSPVWLLSGTATGVLVATLTSAALALAVVVDALRIPGRGQLLVRRLAPTVIGVGDERDGSYEIESLWRAPLRIFVAQRASESFVSVIDPSVLRLGPGATLALPFHLTGVQRGVVPLGAVALTVVTPLGPDQAHYHLFAR